MGRQQILAVVLLVLVGATPGHAAVTGQLQSENERINYSVGYQIGGDFQRQRVELNAEVLVQGIRDAREHKSPLLTAQEMTATLQELKKKIVADERLLQEQHSLDFLAKNRQKDGVVELSSGVQYRILVSGSGPSPTVLDSVRINFRTTTSEGALVSDTFTSNDQKVYALDQVQSGLQAVLLLMQEGGRYEVVIPPGHGGRRRGEALDARGVLIYEIELLAVIPAAKPKG